eukprot:scaffold931_cov383-Prasinococcus_capsulatus_cf.AAC.34
MAAPQNVRNIHQHFAGGHVADRERVAPYGCTPMFKKPCLFTLEIGLSFRHGESVCAPTTWNGPPVSSNEPQLRERPSGVRPACRGPGRARAGLPGRYLPPTANATTVDMFRVMKYLPPGCKFHACVANNRSFSRHAWAT